VTAGTYRVGFGPGSHLAAARRQRHSTRSTIVIGLAGAALLIAITVPFMSRYGWDRDELYFVSAAHHLAFGYVDFPPLIAVAGWITGQLAPHSLVALRAVSLAAGAGTVVLVALIARELGGGPKAQWIAVAAWALTPYILGSGSIFHPTWLDALAWISFLYVAVRLLVRREPRLWLLLGLIAGVGLEAKYTIGFLILCFVLALMLTKERRQLASRWPWLGLALAAALIAPNLVWQAQHGWPSIQFFSSQDAKTAAGTSRPAYLLQQLLFLGSTSILAGAGMIWMWRARMRTLALIPAFVVLIFFLEGGRSYYPLPADALAVAAGAVAADGWLRGKRELALLGIAVVLQGAVVALAGPIVVPFYSTQQLVHSSLWRVGYFKDEIGWPEMTLQVEQAWAQLRPTERGDGVILARNYGEASALEFYGHGLPSVVSGHLSWQYWHPKRLPQHFALTVGYGAPVLELLCSSWKPLARIDNRWRLDNEERGQLIAACALKQPLGSDWNRLIATDQL
jgi:4-amino-4-deoxy-L-arabinose transferase-like glycosyltransferase